MSANLESQKVYEEKKARTKSGIAMLLLILVGLIGSVVLIILGGFRLEAEAYVQGTILLVAGIILVCVFPVMFAGLKVVGPNEGLVLTLFGNYYGSIRTEGFYWVNPFCVGVNPIAVSAFENTIQVMATSDNTGKKQRTIVSKKLSLKAMTLNNERQKINDELGNPVVIGVIVIWKIVNTANAVFNVDNYENYLSIQCDAVIRNVTRRYPYDTSEGGDEKSLRGSSQEVADIMKNELQEKADAAGLEILEVRVTHLSYAQEIASAMLQRQQAAAIIDARQKIVEGAVGMVEMALAKLNENDIVHLDEERKAAMVSNLLVVLCGNKEAQPIVNSGSLY